MSCDEGYNLFGPDQLTCRNGTISPSNSNPSCLPTPCNRIQSPEHGNAQLSPPGEEPRQNSIYTFTCETPYYRRGPKRMECRNGNWRPSRAPRCLPKPCATLRCLNGGTCQNAGNHAYRCRCTRDWNGGNCQYRIVHNDTLTTEVRAFITNTGSVRACKPTELINYLENRYRSYMWFVFCRVRGSASAGYKPNYVITIKYDNFRIWVAWKRQYHGTESRLSRGKTKAAQHLSGVSLNCDLSANLDRIKAELTRINLVYSMVMVVKNAVYSWDGEEAMIFELTRQVDCPRPGGDTALTVLSSIFGGFVGVIVNGATGRYSSTVRGEIYVIVIGAEERSYSVKRASRARGLSFLPVRTDWDYKDCKTPRNKRENGKSHCNKK